MIDHSSHPHPATPAARALCRANGGTGNIGKPGGVATPKTTKKAGVAAPKATPPRARKVPSLTSPKVPVVNLTTGKVISREEAAKRMFGSKVADVKVGAATVKAAQRAGIGRKLEATESDRQKAQDRQKEQADRLKRIADRQRGNTPDVPQSKVSTVRRGEQVRDPQENWRKVQVIDKAGGKITLRDENGIIQRVSVDGEVAKRNSPETAPVTPTSVSKSRARKVAAESKGLLEDYKTGVRSKRNLAGGAMAKTELVTTRSGHKVVRKTTNPTTDRTGRQNDAEELGSKLARAMGMRTPEVARPSKDEIVMDHIPEAVSGFDLNDYQKVTAFTKSDQGKVMGLFDSLFSNTDRHEGNWLIKEGNIYPIDHGQLFSFGTENNPLGEYRTYQVIKWERVDGPPLGTGGEFSDYLIERTSSDTLRADGRRVTFTRWKDNDISLKDVETIENRLTALRPEFERLGRIDWYDKSIRRINSFKPFAKGTKVRIP